MNTISETSKIRAVVFDLDHTLFDRYATICVSAKDMIENRSKWFVKKLSVQRLTQVWIESEEKYIITDGWKRMYDYWAEKEILSTYENKVPVVTADELFEYIWNCCFFKYAIPYPFTADVLENLRSAGVKIGLITNASGEIGIKRQNAKLKILGLEDKFDEKLISGEIGIHKPDRKIFDVMSKRLAIPAQNILYVGDSPINDVDGSRNAGYIPVWVKIRKAWCDGIKHCEYSVENISQIPQLVDMINSSQI